MHCLKYNNCLRFYKSTRHANKNINDEDEKSEESLDAKTGWATLITFHSMPDTCIPNLNTRYPISKGKYE